MQSEEANRKGYILYDSIYITFWKWQNYRQGEQISGYQELRRAGGGREVGVFIEAASVWKDRKCQDLAVTWGNPGEGMWNLSV